MNNLPDPGGSGGALLPDHPALLRDKADLFDFVCRMASPGAIGAWWDSYPVGSLPNGGRSPRNHAEAEQFMRHTRGEAIKAGLWRAL